MLIAGLTGSIGMGKSTAAARLRAIGVAVCDADAEVHELYRGAAVAPIEAAFPGVAPGGTVDRQKLSAALLADPSALPRLEAIVHPLVQAAERQFLIEVQRAGGQLAVLEIPLLFETNGDARCDVTIVVSAGAEAQRARVLARPGMSEAKLAAILARQMPDEEKRRRADFVVDTSTTIEATERQIDAIVSALRERRGTAFQRLWAGR
ncbi:MAG: dephospho-CoA kinase [Hyphomicrobiaceae bacterium]